MAPGTAAARLAVGKLALDMVLVGRAQARQAVQRGVGKAAAPAVGMEVGGRGVGKQAVAETVLG